MVQLVIDLLSHWHGLHTFLYYNMKSEVASNDAETFGVTKVLQVSHFGKKINKENEEVASSSLVLFQRLVSACCSRHC